MVSPDVRKSWKENFFFLESKTFKKFSCTLRIQFCQACQENFAIVLIMFQLMSKTDRVFFLQKSARCSSGHQKRSSDKLAENFWIKSREKFRYTTKMTLIVLLFWKKSFSATSWMQFWLALRKAFSRKGENLFPQGPDKKQFFWEKTSNFLWDT